MAGMAPRAAGRLVDDVAATGLLAAGGPLVLLCSAGRDSACLLDVVVRVLGSGAVVGSGRGGGPGAPGLHVLHVDHGLRGPEAAAADEAVVRAWCAALRVPLVVRRADAGSAPVGDGASGNLHAWARAERARLADELVMAVGAARVVTAHTRTDLVETAIARLATQPGRRALLSMRAAEGRLVRPLLAAGVTREETADYCRARNLRWRDDPSNADPRFARARVRHGVLPVLRSLNPRAEHAITRTLTELAEESEVLAAIVDAELAGTAGGSGVVGGSGGGASGVVGGSGGGGASGVVGGPGIVGGPAIALTRLAELPAPLARLVLRELCERTLGRPCPRAASRLADVLALGAAATRQGTGSVDVGDGARLQLRAGIVTCAASAGPAAPS